MAHFIGRKDLLADIDNLLKGKEGFIYAVKGNPGMGKSTLLKRVAELHKNKGQLFLDLNDLPPLQTAVEFLQFAAQRATGLKNTEKALAKITGAYQTTGNLIKPYEKVLKKTASLGLTELGDDLTTEEKSKFSTLTKTLVELGGIVYNRVKGNEKTKLGDPELFFLNAFKKDCPLIFIDTYECLQAASAISEQKIAANYSRPQEFLKPSQANIKLQDWLERFLQFLKDNGAKVFVAGRKAGCWDTQAQAVERFSPEEILEFASANQNPQIQQAVEEQPEALLQVLTQLSFGGIPLWLELAVNFVEIALAEGESIEVLAATPSLHDFFETVETDSDLETVNIDNANCKLALFNRVMQHNLDISELAWMMALPRRIDPECLNILFMEQGETIRQAFIKAGLCIVNRIKDPGTFRLHDEIRDLLRAYANYKGWLTAEKIGLIHQRLAQLYKNRYQQSHSIQHLLEQLYHQAMQEGDLRLEQIDDPSILLDMALRLERESQYANMAQVFLRWIDLEPEGENAYFFLGIALRQQGKLDDAIAAFRQQLAVKPDHAYAWDRLGIALALQGKLDEAIAAFRQQLEVKPDHANAWNNLGKALAQQDKLDDAIDAYRQQLAVTPGHAIAWNNLGIALGRQGKLDEAIAAYRQQLEVKLDDADVWYNLGTTYLKLGELVQAQSCYEKALTINSDDTSVLANDTELALLQGDKARCLQRADQCLQLIDNQSEYYVILPFLVWLAEPEKSTEDILKVIARFELNAPVNWDFSDTEPVIQRLDSAQQAAARLLIDYFTGRINVNELLARLDGSPLAQ